MRDPYTGEPDALDVTVTAVVVGRQGTSVIVHAIVEDGTAAEGGEVEVQVSGSAMSDYGIDRCIAELEGVFNRTLRPAYRLDAALAMGTQGTFLIVTGSTGPRVVTPGAGQLAA